MLRPADGMRRPAQGRQLADAARDLQALALGGAASRGHLAERLTGVLAKAQGRVEGWHEDVCAHCLLVDVGNALACLQDLRREAVEVGRAEGIDAFACGGCQLLLRVVAEVAGLLEKASVGVERSGAFAIYCRCVALDSDLLLRLLSLSHVAQDCVLDVGRVQLLGQSLLVVGAHGLALSAIGLEVPLVRHDILGTLQYCLALGGMYLGQVRLALHA